MAFTDSAISIAIDIAKSLVVPIGRQFGYALFYKSNVQALRAEVEKFRVTRLGVESRRDAAVRNGEVVDAKVRKWLDDAKAEEENVKGQLKDWETAGKSCFHGWIPNPKNRYVIGRKAKKTTLAIQELHGEGKFEVISHPDAPEGALARMVTFAANIATAEGALIVPITKQDDEFESRTSLLKLIVKSLLDVNIGMVGVHGPGGVGKSTLIKQVVNHIKAERLFDEVALAIVSANVDVKKIQGELADMLGLKFTNESVHGRAFRLKRRLESGEKKKVLIVLDDLWKELDLEELGIPRNKGLKLLLTSRSQDVLSRKMGSQKNFQVDGLKDDEPWKLFRKMVGEIADDPKMKPIAEEVVEKCLGLPILLKALATTLKNSNHSQWEDALEQLRRSKDVYSSLELSYNNLEGEELKYLFLICSLLGKGEIPVEDLLRYVVGLGLLEGVTTMKKARDRLSALLHTLRASSLLLEDADSDYVKIHDIIREVAVTIASRDRHVLVANGNCRLEDFPKETIKKSTVISMPWVDVPELPEGLQCPELKMLLYLVESNEKSDSSKVPDSFFEGMCELQVLDVCYLHFSSLPPSIQVLENLTTLRVDYCTLEDVTIIGNLKRLQILSFMGSSISHLPKEISQLCDLRMLDLSHCSQLEKIEPGVLKSLARLEELYMENSFTKWEKEGEAEQNNARLAELNNMPGLSTLDILIPEATLLPKVLPLENLFKYRILVGDDWDWSSDHIESRTLKLKLDSRNTLMEKWVQATLPRTHDLHLDGLRGRKKSIHELSVEGFHELKHLHVKNSPLVQYVVRSLKWLPCSAFTMLESLFLEDLVNLENICHGDLALESFSKIKVIKVKNCGKLLNLFPHCLIKGFSQLEEIDISACEMFREIVVDVGMEDNVDEATRNAIVEMPTLRRLTLKSLPEMTSFRREVSISLFLSGTKSEIISEDELRTVALPSGYHISFPGLESLELSQLPNLDEIWSSDSSLEPDNLKSLIVKECGKLFNIITSGSLLQLRNLETLSIESCEAVKEVFDLEELNLDPDVSVLPQLHEMELVDLPHLRCMWNRNPTGVTPLRNMKSLKVTKCSNLKYLFHFSAAKALEHIKEIEIAECSKMEVIVMEEEEGEVTDTLIFQSLSSISLRGLPNLTAFAHGNYSVSFPELKLLEIRECPKMKAFSTGDYLMPSEGGNHSNEENATMACLSFFNEKVLLPSLEDLQLASMSSLKWIWHDKNLISEPSSFCRLVYMLVEECENLIAVFPSALIERIQHNLKEARIYYCPSVEVIFEASASNAETMNCESSAMMLYELENLHLGYLPNLKQVLEGDSHVVTCFPSLREIFVRGCHSLAYFLPNTAAQYLLKLEELTLGECPNMLEVVVNGEGGHGMTHPISFPRLKSLELWELNSLISFSSGNHEFDFPSLEQLSIYQCDSFETFIMRPASDKPRVSNQRLVGDFGSADTVGTPLSPFFDEKVEFPRLETIDLSYMRNLQKLWEDELSLDSFGKLRSMTIKDCKNLTSIFQLEVIGRFQNLETLAVHDCDSLEVVFRLQGETDGSAISVPLKGLEITGLPKMKCLWDKDPQGSLIFGKLERIEVVLCGKLEYLFPTSVARGLVQIQKIDISDCGVLEELVARSAVETPGDDGVQLLFPRLHELRFRRLPNLKRLLPVNYSLEWSTLKILYAYACGKVKIFASDLPPSSEAGDSDCQQALLSIEQVIPNLKRLGLGSEDVLMIQDGDFPDNIFDNLKFLCLAYFEEASSSVGFPSRFLLDKFPDLQIRGLNFSYCSFEEIFPDEGPGPQGTLVSYRKGYSNGGKYSKAFKSLRKLSLISLHNLRCIWKQDSLAAEVLKRIEWMAITSCDCLITLFPTASDSFHNLMELYIRKCNGLMYLMTPSAARGLPRLARMVIIDCEKIEKVIAANGSSADVEICFPRLEHLELERLPILSRFSSANCSLTFPLLEGASITDCPNMKNFSEGTVSSPKLYQVDSRFSWLWFDNLNTTVQKLSTYYK